MVIVRSTSKTSRSRAAGRAARRARVARAADDLYSAPDGASGNFERLIARNAWLFPAPERDAEREALDAFWRQKGAIDGSMRAALVKMGKDLATQEAARELYGDPEALGHAVERLEALLPNGTSVARMLWHCPDVLKLPLREIAQRMIALKRAFPRANAERILEGNPGALLTDDLERVAAALEELQREFPRVDMNAVVNFEPYVVHESLPSRVRAIKGVKPGNRSPSLRAFYPPPSDAPDGRTEPASNAALFAKVFLLETDGCYPRSNF